VTTSRFAPGRAAARLTLPVADLLALVCAAAIAGLGGWWAAIYATSAWVALAVSGLHRLRICLRAFDQAGRCCAAVAVGVACVLPWVPAVQAGRLAVSAAVLVIGCRSAALAGLRAAHRRGWLDGAALLVGTDETARQLAGLLQGHPALGLRSAGLLASGSDAARQPVLGPGTSRPPVLGQLADLSAVVTRYRISHVIVCPGAGRDGDVGPMLFACRAAGADVCVVLQPFEPGVAVPRSCRDEIVGIPLLPLRGRHRLAAGLAMKRLFDLALATALLAVTAPLLVVLAVVSRLQLRRPALFRQVRVVGSGKLAEIVKLRTVTGHADPDTYWAPSERQCTRFGWILRASHLDELPQLVNVLRGEMSLVGPRPERPYFARQFAREIPGYGDRERMRAGMTGWAQVHGLNGDTSIRDRVRFDNSYIDYWSFWFDLVILARTVPALVGGAFHLSPRTPAARAVHSGVPQAARARGRPEVPPSPAPLIPSSAKGDRQ
jgi:lipopolysaccharide/colanic/teichoic acid biosynthesis glycosyltransferase